MSHHKTCPFCGKETRCPWEERNVEEPCYECEPTFAAGYEAAVRDFWRGVCEQMAAKADADAVMYSCRADDDAIAGHGYAARGARDDAAICRQGARQLRRWLEATR